MTPHQLHLKREGSRRYRLKYPDKVREEKRLYRLRHPDVIRAAKKRYRLRHPEKIRRSQRKHSLRWKYGMTLADYDRMAVAGCAICGTHPDPDALDRRVQVLHADHDHFTGQFRGLLCRDCNMGIGFLKDDPTILRRARQYLMDT